MLVHPDKQKGKPAAQVMLAERVFEKLKVRACCCGLRRDELLTQPPRSQSHGSTCSACARAIHQDSSHSLCCAVCIVCAVLCCVVSCWSGLV